jgi:hypothetical protein
MISPVETTVAESFAGLFLKSHSTRSCRVLSEGDARRRSASPVPGIYPRRTRALHDQTTRNAYLQVFLCEPSDELEPSTPSLPWSKREPLCGQSFSQVDADRSE